MNKRPVCSKCGFILARCLCDSLENISNHTHIIILQHPSESKHALNTVALMQKSFANIKVFIGEDFSEHAELNSLFNDHLDSIALLFPTDSAQALKYNSEKKITHIVLIDGTWKKAQKIYILSKNLQTLPSYKLEVASKGRYIIRSTDIENGLSTLEASISALNILENELDTKSLMNSFKKMIDFQIEKMGPETFKKNYGNKD